MRCTEVIAEIGQAHDGSLGILYSLVDAIANAGVRIIKFQMHIAESESSQYDQFRIQFSKEDSTRMDYWRRMELSVQQWSDLKLYCESLGCEFLCTPFSVHAVKILESINVTRYKVGSGDINNHLLLKQIANTRKPVILSTGLATFDEIDQAMKIFLDSGSNVTLMQCTSEYPAPAKNWGLNLISELKERFDVDIGFSDHSGKISAGIAAATLGAKLVEVHVTFDKRMFGPDSLASLTIEELALLNEGVSDVNTSLSEPQHKENISGREKMRKLFGRSLIINREIEKGEKIEFEDLEAVKPFGLGINPVEYHKIIGKCICKKLKKGNFLKWEHFGNEE